MTLEVLLKKKEEVSHHLCAFGIEDFTLRLNMPCSVKRSMNWSALYEVFEQMLEIKDANELLRMKHEIDIVTNETGINFNDLPFAFELFKRIVSGASYGAIISYLATLNALSRRIYLVISSFGVHSLCDVDFKTALFLEKIEVLITNAHHKAMRHEKASIEMVQALEELLNEENSLVSHLQELYGSSFKPVKKSEGQCLAKRFERILNA